MEPPSASDMAETDRLYPPIEPYDMEPLQVPAAVAADSDDGEEKFRACDGFVMWDEEPDAPAAPEEVIRYSLFDSSGTEFACR